VTTPVGQGLHSTLPENHKGGANGPDGSEGGLIESCPVASLRVSPRIAPTQVVLESMMEKHMAQTSALRACERYESAF